ncbi:hypothetical protein [Undibacterium terreum]|uniref:Uncharacterized protein n=1 Tax=Undibacterium terreum TaxID=1224302 RepID=A0A916XDA7_9BURK|nr:hypothetical protein [Undibacterium terreum]GGC63402.1 hypothetical protein GCM10011396_07930 [Undibacterium terreum]
MFTEARFNTSQFDVTPFKAHGYLDARFDGNIAWHEATGPFNLEFVHTLKKTLQALHTVVKPVGRWAEIVVVNESAIMSLAAYEAMDQMIGCLLKQGRAASAFAHVSGADVEGRTVMAIRYEKLFNKHNLPYRSFDNMQEAETWVTQILQE